MVVKPSAANLHTMRPNGRILIRTAFLAILVAAFVWEVQFSPSVRERQAATDAEREQTRRMSETGRRCDDGDPIEGCMCSSGQTSGHCDWPVFSAATVGREVLQRNATYTVVMLASDPGDAEQVKTWLGLDAPQFDSVLLGTSGRDEVLGPATGIARSKIELTGNVLAALARTRRSDVKVTFHIWSEGKDQGPRFRTLCANDDKICAKRAARTYLLVQPLGE